MVINAARKAGITTPIEFDEAEFSLNVGADGQAFLGNAYDFFRQAGWRQRKKILANVVSLLRREQSKVTREMALRQCVAAVRETALFSFTVLRGQLGPTPSKIAHQPISEWFSRTIVVDSPGAMAMVSTEDLESWNLTFEELFEAGLERLRGCTTPKFQEIDGYFQGTWDDDYDSSRILLPELSRSLPIDEPVFCLPSRLKLLVAEAAKPNAVEAMLTRAEWICQNEPRPNNPSPLTRRNGKIEDFTVDETSPDHLKVKRAHRFAALMYYQEQKAILEEVHEKTGKGIFVGPYTLNAMENGDCVSWVTWAKGIPTLMPKTDLVVFGDPDQPKETRVLHPVKWADVQQTAGDLMLDAEMFPPRYYVSQYPTDEQLAAMSRQPIQ